MKDKQPILSICIPTYNRAEILDVALRNYIENPEFDDSVEIVISDNASTDNTQSVCEKYAKIHTNISYYRNEENVCDANFPKVLNYGNGKYLKLLNDCVYLDEQALHYVKTTIRENFDSKQPLFFTSGYIYVQPYEQIYCASLDEYIRAVSLGTTNNNMFGAWKKDWDAIQDKWKYAELKLQQVDWSCQIVVRNGGAKLYNQSILSYCPTPKMHRSPYNWFKVHLDNYYTILKPYNEKGYLSSKALRHDRKIFLNFYKKHLYRIYFMRKDIGFDTTGTLGYFFKHFKYDIYFYWFVMTLPIRFVYDKSKSIIERKFENQ